MKMAYLGVVLCYLLFALGILSIGIAMLKMAWLFMLVGIGLIAAAILFKQEFKLDIFPWCH